MRKKYKWDPLLTQIAKGLAETAEKATNGIVKIEYPTEEYIQQDEILYYSPLADPVNFLKRPFGTKVREQVHFHLCKIADHAAAVWLLCDKYPWLISEEDKKLLDEFFYKVDRIHVNKKG